MTEHMAIASSRPYHAGLPPLSLQQQAGRTSDAVRVGTVKCGRAPAFEQVSLAHVDPRALEADPADPLKTEQAWRDRERRALSVEMTGARDRL